MKVLAIQPGHNSTVAVADDGQILGVLSQEKLDNIKNSGAFPFQAINALLNELCLNKSDIEYVLISSKNISIQNLGLHYDPISDRVKFENLKKLTVDLIGYIESNPITWSVTRVIFNTFRITRLKIRAVNGRKHAIKALRDFGFLKQPVEFIEHHLCHTQCVIHSFQKTRDIPSLVFTLDGMGDTTSGSVSISRNNTLIKLGDIDFEASLGLMYSMTTKYLGMKPLEHEYKVMGLSAYPKHDYWRPTYEKVFKNVIRLTSNNSLKFKSKINMMKFYHYLSRFAIGLRFDNISAALQYSLEELVETWVKNGIALTKISNICLSGGVFMNVKLNKRLQEIPDINKITFMPSCGDESLPIGACYDFFVRHHIETKPLKNLYLGLSYSDDLILENLQCRFQGSKISYKYVQDIESEVANLLADRKVVARFKGRCEWGARSLGNRAILGHPKYLETFYQINNSVKARDFWMPFAPTILSKYATLYLKDYVSTKNDSKYMITSYEATNLGRDCLRAALHQGDHTLRPQILYEEDNPDYHKLLSYFASITDIGGILNTSFNLHGYPLVATPDQAFFTFENSDLNYLAIGSFIVYKG